DCDIDTCTTSPSTPTHGSSDVTSGVYEDVATLQCDIGYHGNGQLNTVTCQAGGSWSSNTLFDCDIDTCTTSPSTPTHGSSDVTTGVYEDVATFQCDTGY
ncbi:CCP domain-containing protein, partial [Lacticaseibacillus paracasei]|nr:CCP domain-containing protein [Lacticaseibacillus paracasei]